MEISSTSEEVLPKKLSPFDFLTSINEGSRGVSLFTSRSVEDKDYVAFIVNRGLSQFSDSILLANEMNQRANIAPIMQYDFLRHALRARKRYGTWAKKEEIENLEVIQEVYGYSKQKAREVISLFSSDYIKKLKDKLDHGGKGTLRKRK